MMRALVTGASGFVGSAVVRELLAHDYRVRALVRNTSNQCNLTGLPIERVVGDLDNSASLLKALTGCDVLFHVAASYHLWTRDPKEMYRTNVEGTKRLLNLAKQASVSRIVYTSSVATLGLNRDGAPADENSPVGLEDMIGHYKRSKYLAEEAVRGMIKNQGLPAVIVNPSTPVGPRDIRPTPTGQMIRDAAFGHMPAYVDTGLNIVHVDDVATGHRLALEYGKVGERYILGGENMTLREILNEISRATGRAPPRIRLPNAVVMPIAYLSEAWARLRQVGEPLVSVDGVRLAKKKMFFSSAKAEKALGYRYRPAILALNEAVTWYQSQRPGNA